MFKLQKQPNRWSCFPTAVAMVINVPVEELLAKLPNGGKEYFPEYTDSRRYRGYHPQEIMELLLLDYGKYMLPFTANPFIGHPKFSMSCPMCGGSGLANIKKIRSYKRILLKKYVGVVQIGNHALAWDGSVFYEPTNAVFLNKTKVLDNVEDFYAII